MVTPTTCQARRALEPRLFVPHYLQSDLRELPKSLWVSSLPLSVTYSNTAMAFVCTGCEESFSLHQAFMQHLRKTTNRACIQVHQALVSSIRRPIRHDRLPRRCHSSSRSSSPNNPRPVPTPSSSTGPQVSQSDPVDEEPEDVVTPFEGDYFGSAEEYGEADFPYGEDEVSEAGLDEVPAAALPTIGQEGNTWRVTVVDEDEDDAMDEAVGLDALEQDVPITNSGLSSRPLKPS